MTYKPNHPQFLLAYQFDVVTGRYINVTLAHINPAESLGSEAKYFVEDDSTLDPVPHVAPEGKDWYRKGGQSGEWLLVDDTDAMTWYDAATGQSVAPPKFGEPVPTTMTSIAPTPAGGEVIVGFDAKAKKWTYRKSLAGTVVYNTSDHTERVLSVDDIEVPTGYTLLKPESTAYDWGGDAWVLNIERQTIIDAHAQKQAIINAVNDVKHALQTHIDGVATGLGFSGGNSLMLYAGFDNPFTALAQSFGAWEAGVWVDADAYMTRVQAGVAPMLTPDEAVALVTDFKFDK